MRLVIWDAIVLICCWDSMVTNIDIMTWKYFLHYWPCVMGIHQSLVDQDSPKKGRKCRTSMLLNAVCLKKAVEQPIRLPIIWDIMTLIWHQCNAFLRSYKISYFNFEKLCDTMRVIQCDMWNFQKHNSALSHISPMALELIRNSMQLAYDPDELLNPI